MAAVYWCDVEVGRCSGAWRRGGAAVFWRGGAVVQRWCGVVVSRCEVRCGELMVRSALWRGAVRGSRWEGEPLHNGKERRRDKPSANQRRTGTTPRYHAAVNR